MVKFTVPFLDDEYGGNNEYFIDAEKRINLISHMAYENKNKRIDIIIAVISIRIL